MVKINLLPYRQTKQIKAIKRFFLFVGVSIGLALAISIAIYSYYKIKINIQENRISMLNKGLGELDKQLDTIKTIQNDINDANSRKNIVETLQANRTRTVKLLNILATPESGISYKSIIQKNNSIEIIGLAQNNSNIAVWLKSLENSILIKSPALIESKDSNGLKEFKITANIVDFSADIAEKDTKKTDKNKNKK